MKEPRRDHYIAPATGPDSAAVLDAAIVSLASARNLVRSDTGVAVHLLASLLAEAQAGLRRAVNDARDRDCSWAEIADLLGVTRASAWQRYAARAEPEAINPVEG